MFSDVGITGLARNPARKMRHDEAALLANYVPLRIIILKS